MSKNILYYYIEITKYKKGGFYKIPICSDILRDFYLGLQDVDSRVCLYFQNHENNSGYLTILSGWCLTVYAPYIRRIGKSNNGGDKERKVQAFARVHYKNCNSYTARNAVIYGMHCNDILSLYNYIIGNNLEKITYFIA